MTGDRLDELIRDAIHEQFNYDPALLAEVLARFESGRTVETVATTFRHIADWFGPEWERKLIETADHVERDPMGSFCPVCQEVICDEDCPLARMRPSGPA